MSDQQLNLDQLEELETRIVPLLKRRGIDVQDIQPIGLLGRGSNSSVFSLLINNQYHVLKVYSLPTSYAREMRNRKRLIWPSPIVMTSKRSENSLGYDIVVTKSPKGETFTSKYLLQWVMEKLTDHLLELHSIRRSRTVSAQSLIDRLSGVTDGARAIAKQVRGQGGEIIVLDAHRRALEVLNKHRSSFRVQHSLIHNDLWWDNIIVARDDVYLIDWEAVKTGDYLEDLARLRVMFDHQNPENPKGGFWRDGRYPAAANAFMAGIIDTYALAFNDQSIYQRYQVYLTFYSLHWLDNMYNLRHKLDVKQRVEYLLEDLQGYWDEDFGL